MNGENLLAFLLVFSFILLHCLNFRVQYKRIYGKDNPMRIFKAGLNEIMTEV